MKKIVGLDSKEINVVVGGFICFPYFGMDKFCRKVTKQSYVRRGGVRDDGDTISPEGRDR